MFSTPETSIYVICQCRPPYVNCQHQGSVVAEWLGRWTWVDVSASLTCDQGTAARKPISHHVAFVSSIGWLRGRQTHHTTHRPPFRVLQLLHLRIGETFVTDTKTCQPMFFFCRWLKCLTCLSADVLGRFVGHIYRWEVGRCKHWTAPYCVHVAVWWKNALFWMLF